jgi:glycosyltransferase involved in cell wall biosynthesis
LKIILSVDALSPVLTGIGRYTWELSSRLDKHKRVDKIRFYRNGLWIKNPNTLLDSSASKPLQSWYARTSLHETILSWQCRGNIFHGPNFFLPACADSGVITVHDLSVFKFPETHPIERIKHFEKHFSSSVKRAEHIITDSEVTRLEVIDFLGWAPDKITAVHLGVAPSFQSSTSTDKSNVLKKYNLPSTGYSLTVSTLEPRKKIDSLIKAYELLPVYLRTLFPLVIVGGKGWLSDDLHALISAKQEQGWLHYFGFVPESDLPHLYAGAKSFVYPSQYEGYGLPPLEAMAAGVPVITSNYSCLPEVTGGAALTLDTSDIELLATTIASSLEDQRLRADLIQKGFDVVAGRTWDACIQKTVSVYQKIESA